MMEHKIDTAMTTSASQLHLNPIENLWFELKRDIHMHKISRNIMEFKMLCTEEGPRYSTCVKNPVKRI